MARLVAASGMTAVTHSNREPLPDAKARLDHLAANGRKIGIWQRRAMAPSCSRPHQERSCHRAHQPDDEGFRPETPLFVVRAGNERRA